ncbi:hypothetical protein NliqN6_3957 [Naganishia liquefaciens]|uniref:Uncharacterized protein n=1 Tax=Naganishia liquefaciens TaxID=104408 RepID=A0A8H3TVM6_9TREE|nr:hypothetical protein NliqN6_3957 [Naganishia liquefaciens]
MNAPWGSGIANEGPELPFGSQYGDQAYQPTRIPGYEVHYGAYHTLTKGVFLPAGTMLPGGCNFAQGACIDFPLHFPDGTTCPGGIMVPVTLAKKEEKKREELKPPSAMDVICLIQ